MDKFVEFSLSNWGVTFSSAPLYFNLSWGLVIVIIGGYLAHRIIKVRRGK